MNAIFTQSLMTLFFATIVLLHMVKKKSVLAIIYGLQSFAIVLLLISSFFHTGAVSLLLIALLVLAVKVILAPLFITRLIKKHDLKFLVGTYANTPLTLIIVAVFVAIAHSKVFLPLVDIIPANRELLSLVLSALFISLFLLVNRKGALSQIIGVLSLENSIVAFGLLAGLEQTPALQIGIIFNLSVWIVIATIFISMIYKHFGSLDVTEMTHLKD
ncbi:MAG: hypothetical protein V2A78_09380 [bacterium]